MSSESEKISAVMILEVMGRPAEYVTSAIEDMVKKLGAEKGVSLVDRKINPPVKVKDQENLFTTFAELEIQVEEISVLTSLMFKYMPSHIEIIDPEKINISNINLNSLLNELVMKLHRYDEVARILQVEKSLLERKLKEILQPKLTAREDLSSMKKEVESKLPIIPIDEKNPTELPKEEKPEKKSKGSEQVQASSSKIRERKKKE